MSSTTSFITWVQKHLTAIYTSTSEAAFTEAFNDFFQGASIVLNGKEITLDEYQATILSQRNFSFTHPSITFDKSLESPISPGPGFGWSSSVGIFFQAVVDFANPIGKDAGGNIIVTSSLNVVVNQMIPVGKEYLGVGLIGLVKLNQVMTKSYPDA